MPRLHLVSILFFFMVTKANGQSELSKYLKYAKEQTEKGDFFYALEYYQKALDIYMAKKNKKPW